MNTKYIDKNKLVKTYKVMQLDPTKAFVMKDFGTNSDNILPYMLTLKKLELIEEVKIYWLAGGSKKERRVGTTLRNTKGWRLKNEYKRAY